MKATVFFRLIGFLMFCVMLAAPAVQAQQTPDPPSDRPRIGDIATIPHMQGSGESPAGSNQQLAALLPWSRVTYQSYRDGNWEIYSNQDDGGNLARLTADPATDMMPRLNRGGTKIVFVSRRAGSNYQIFTMNPDGSGVTQLTATAADNVNPVWSPNGSLIAFESYRDGQAEIYIMAANGSNQIRLTAGGLFNAQPTWSPDGAKIAFVSYRTGGYRIWVMNADSSNQVQYSNQSFSLRPVWSPDGSRIAYDADGNNNGWQELWTMQADGTNQQLLKDPQSIHTDLWASGWSPDGRYVAHTHISFVQYFGNWYWNQAFIGATNAANPADSFSIGQGATNWNADWQTLDAQIPTSQVQGLPPYSRTHNFNLHWWGTDSGGSGLAGFDLQYRQGAAGLWTNWLNGVGGSFAPFPATPGTTLSFRSRATDNSLNREAWPAGGDTSTTFYTWQFGGRVTDNRGIPLNGVPITINPNPMTGAVTNIHGRFFTRLLANGSHNVNLNRPGYGLLPLTPIDLLQDQSHDFYLPPQGNLLLNSGFEAGPQLSNWTTGGGMPRSVTTFERSTGQQAATAGYSCTYPCLGHVEELPDANVHFSSKPTIVTDSRGRVHLLFTANADRLSYRFRDVDGVWSEPVVIGNTGTNYAYEYFLGIDEHDSLYAVWDGADNRLYFSSKAFGDNWETPTILADTYYNAEGMVVGRDGAVHILTLSNNHHYIERLASGHWQAPVPLAGVGGQIMGMSLGLDDDGVVYALWEEYVSVGNRCPFYLRTHTPGGGWSAPAEIDPDLGACFAQASAVVPDSLGGLHVIWRGQSSQWFHRYRNPQQQWSTEQAVAPGETILSTALDSAQNLHLVSEMYNDAVYYRRWRPGSGWDTLTTLGSPLTAERLSLAIAPDDTLHLVLQNTTTGYRIYHLTTSLATVTGHSLLQQTVTIPAAMNAPTLAFRYLLNGDLPGDLSRLEISVTNGVSETVTTFAGTGQWQHGLLDLSMFQGDNVTAVFMLFQQADDPYLRLYLDDISLGASYPDLLVSAAGGSTALPGETIQLTLHYANRGGVSAAQATITTTLPAGLSFVSANITPTLTSPALVWNVGDLASLDYGTILITATVSPSAAPLSSLSIHSQITSAAPEVETANNVSTSIILIGRQLYLPVVQRP